VVLTLEHIISREIAERYGMLDALIDSEWHLVPMCEEDNSGNRWLNPAVGRADVPAHDARSVRADRGVPAAARALVAAVPTVTY
jgi:hypothetical protein